MYRDGVDYDACLRCGGEVDWIDIEARPLGTPPPPYRMARYAFVVFLVVQTLFALFDPEGFPYLAQILVIAQMLGLAIVACALVMSRDIRNLVDHRTRILHGLEHATIRVLEERGIFVRSGQTYRGEFELVLDHEGRNWERWGEYRAAATDAIRRVIAGEHALAYSIHCGTSYLVAISLYAIAIVVAGLVAHGLGAPVGIVWATTVGAALSARAIARRTGLAVQRWLTVSTDIEHAAVTGVEQRPRPNGNRFVVTIAVFVQPAAREGGLVSPTPLG